RENVNEGKILQGFIRQKAALDAFDSARRLHKIKCPTLVIHGEEDIMVPPYMGEAIARGISDSEMVYIPGAGHIIPPESCYAHIISFLERHSIKLPQAVDVKMASMAK
ncbi:MAG TPA: alpha/beta fold hydrolase, partial [Methanomassiliicoccaceae archaeon]|nr:alpha/beta fold hydrolase [Methanomassiliicoccaceae archaeon]